MIPPQDLVSISTLTEDVSKGIVSLDDTSSTSSQELGIGKEITVCSISVEKISQSARSSTSSPIKTSYTGANCLRIQQSLLILVHLHLLKRFSKASCEDTNDYHLLLLTLIQRLHTFAKKVGYVSRHFFESALLAIKQFFQTNTFDIFPENLPHLCSFASFFGAKVQSVFVYVYGSFNVEQFSHCFNLISGLQLNLDNHNDLEFLNKASYYFPRLKQLDVIASISNSISIPLIELLKVNTTITCLCLWNNSLEDKGVRALADALKVNTTLTSVNLCENSIGANGAKALADTLKVNTTLTRVDLENNSIGDEGATALADALKVNDRLTRIGLYMNYIGDEGAIALAEALKVNNTVTTVNLGQNSIGAEGAKALADALKVNTTLTSVNLYMNFIGDEGARTLAEALTVNIAVTCVDLCNNSIGFEGVKSLSEALKINNSVVELCLGANSIGDHGAKALAATLKINNKLTNISLFYALIGDEGAIALANALKCNSTVSSIDIGNNTIGDEGVRAFAETMTINGIVTIEGVDLPVNVIN
ncbi:hypothetical protein GEMRC1_009574 [Eukaryota sp. GEM-RC1]